MARILMDLEHYILLDLVSPLFIAHLWREKQTCCPNLTMEESFAGKPPVEIGHYQTQEFGL